MRGRKPCPLSIGFHDCTILQEVARSETLPWYQVRRARTVLAIASGQRTVAVASRLECDGGTVCRTCRRYNDTGIRGLLEEPRRPGRFARIPPSSVPRSSNSPAWNRSPRACTSPTGQARTWLGRSSPMV